MKRDLRLRGLSSDHHHALVLALELSRAAPPWTRARGKGLAARFAAELEPHFQIEEEVLLPALRAVAALHPRVLALIAQTEADHAALRALATDAEQGTGDAARQLGERLREHVRFEERELFVVCEELLPGEVLDEVARRGGVVGA